MDHKYLNEKGSFKAWGIGLHYEFDADSNILDVIDGRLSRPIIYIDVDQVNDDAILEYVTTIDRISQLYALNFSNQSSIDITEILGPQRLKPIMNNIATTALHAVYLHAGKFSSFNQSMNTDLMHHKLLIRKIKASRSSASFYSACLKTSYGITIPKIQDRSLHKVLAEMSAEISTSMIADHIISAADMHLNTSIKIASELSLLSATLNPDLKPSHLLVRHNKSKQNQKFA